MLALGEVTVIYHMFYMRPNAGKIPTFFKKLWDKNNGTSQSLQNDCHEHSSMQVTL